MPLVHIIVLSLIQGLTEFLPVSSSAHLILGGQLIGWEDQGLVFDVATHLGTLIAVLVYFRSDLLEMFKALIRPVTDQQSRHNRSLLVFIALATIPALLVGALAHDLIEAYLRNMAVIAVTTLVFGLVLWWSDRVGSKWLELSGMNLRSALIIGLFQVLALVPGVSRSGITITAGRFLGFTADSAARFSFLLGIPLIAAAGAYGALRVASDNAEINWLQFGLAVGFSALAGWVCISAFLAILRRVGLLPFVIYRLLLACVLIWIVF